MSKFTLFISHSWDDKFFVNRLCANLLSESFNVWLDNLSTNVGESLLDKIFTSIDSSDFLLAVISKSSVNSKWCNDEINAALTLEKRENRIIVIPILIDQTELPLKLGDRIYIDARQSLYSAFSIIVSTLSKYGVKKRPSNIVPLLFDSGAELDQELFRRSIDSIINKNKLVFWDIQDTLYIKLKEVVSKRAEDSSHCRNVFREILSLEAALNDGLKLIMNNATKTDDDVTLASYWFCRIIRYSILARLKEFTEFIDKPDSVYDLTKFESVYSSSRFWEQFYEFDEEITIAIYQREEEYAFRVSYPRGKRISNDLLQSMGYPNKLSHYWEWEFRQKFIWPQRVYYATYNKSPEPIPWTPEDLMIGIA